MTTTIARGVALGFPSLSTKSNGKNIGTGYKQAWDCDYLNLKWD